MQAIYCMNIGDFFPNYGKLMLILLKQSDITT
jgi:hypothetical protein